MKKSIEDFIKSARLVHGDKYDYSKVNYVNAITKVIISCSEHGDFLQKPNGHLQGRGCPVCCKNKKLTIETFIQKARAKHGEKYDYSKVIYYNNSTKISIICPRHGEFLQDPAHHLSGNGCSKCQDRGFKYLPLEEVKKIIKQHNIKREADYLQWWYKNKEYCRKNGIPLQPDKYYKRNK